MKNIFKFIIILFAVVSLGSLLSCDLFGNFRYGSNHISNLETEGLDSSESKVETEQKDSSDTEFIENQDNLIFQNVNYIAFGDSITFGLTPKVGSKLKNPYPELVAETLNFKSVANEGFCGGTICRNNLNYVCVTEMVLSSTKKADIISVMLGVNDYANNLPLGDINDKSVETVYGGLNLIAEHLITTQEDAFIFFMTPYKYKPDSGYCTDINEAGYTLEDVAIAVKQVAAKYDIAVLDMYNEGQFELEMYNANSDGIHPSQEFIREYTAPQIAEFIRQNYRGK